MTTPEQHQNQLAQPQQPDALLDIHNVMKATSLSKASVYRLMNDGHFPKGKELIPGGRRVAWLQSQVMAWIADPLGWNAEAHF